jgi:DNA-binding winged helix-turn-helix (wHTH) protein
MAYKPSLRNLHRKCWLPEQGQRPVIQGNQNVETGAFSRATREKAGLSVLGEHRLCPPALREMLASDNYEVALVPRGQPFSNTVPKVLLPFSWKELVARVCESVRDCSPLAEYSVARFEDVCVDFTKMEVRRSSGESITLTAQEFKTLKCFLLNPDRVFSRDELLNEAWGYENYPSTRTVDNHVLKLRQKLERDPTRPVHFRTVHSVGYKFVP